jgi:hypothetical protein
MPAFGFGEEKQLNKINETAKITPGKIYFKKAKA